MIGISTLLQLYGTSCGILLTDDSLNYLSAGESFRSVREFRSPDGTYFVAWPPLFPLIISMLPEPESGVLIIYVVIKAIITLLLFHMGSRLIQNQTLQIVFLIVSVCGVHLTMISVFLWSELLYLLVLLVAGFLAVTVRTSDKFIILFFLVGLLLCLQRYVGVFFVAAVSLWLIIDRGIPRKRRIILSVSFFLFSVSGLALWVRYIHSVSNEFSFRAYGFFDDPIHNFGNILARTGELFITGPDWLLMGAAVVVITGSILAIRDRLDLSPEIRLLLTIVAVYSAGLIAMGRLDPHELDRLLSTYVPFIYLIFFCGLDSILRKRGSKVLRAGVVIVVLWSCYPLTRTWQNVELWHHRSCFGVLDK